MHFHGSLDMFSAGDALRVLSARGATGRFVVSATNGDHADLWLDLGMVVAGSRRAETAELVDVVAAITSWTVGEFTFEELEPPDADAAPQPAEMLLSLVDDSDPDISATSELAMAQALNHAPAVIDIVTWQVLRSIEPGMTVATLAAALHAPVAEVEDVVRDLDRRGLIEIVAKDDAVVAEPAPIENTSSDVAFDVEPLPTDVIEPVPAAPSADPFASLIDMVAPPIDDGRSLDDAANTASIESAGMGLFLSADALPIAPEPEPVTEPINDGPRMPLFADIAADTGPQTPTPEPETAVDTPLEVGLEDEADAPHAEGGEPAAETESEPVEEEAGDSRSVLLRFLGSVET